MSFGDERRLPFFMVTKAATKAIRESFESRRGQTALAVYVAIVELANDARSESFEKPRKAIALRAMVNVRVLDSYVAELEGLGLLRVERQRAGDMNLPNRWTLTDPPDVAYSDDTTPAHPDDTRVVPADDTLFQDEGRRGEREEAPLPKISGKPVNRESWTLTALILAEFNRQTERDLRLLTSAGEASEAAKRIYGRVRKYPDLTLDDHERIIANTLASRWWDPKGAENGKPQVGVVYGPNVFEDNISRRASATAGNIGARQLRHTSTDSSHYDDGIEDA